MSDTPAGLSSLQFSVVTGCGALALLLVIANAGLVLNNRAKQADVNARQQFINETVQLGRLNNQIVQALASLSARTGDDSLRGLLAAHGITFTAETTPEAGQ
jgi:hypothetical protein